MIDREALIAKFHTALDNAEIDGNIYAEIRRPDVFDAIKLLKEQESVDHALSVLRAAGWKENPMMDELIVRCKDCREIYYASNRAPHEQTWVCGRHGMDVTPEWYCADGERRS